MTFDNRVLPKADGFDMIFQEKGYPVLQLFDTAVRGADIYLYAINMYRKACRLIDDLTDLVIGRKIYKPSLEVCGVR